MFFPPLAMAGPNPTEDTTDPKSPWVLPPQPGTRWFSAIRWGSSQARFGQAGILGKVVSAQVSGPGGGAGAVGRGQKINGPCCSRCDPALGARRRQKVTCAMAAGKRRPCLGFIEARYAGHRRHSHDPWGSLFPWRIAPAKASGAQDAATAAGDCTAARTTSAMQVAACLPQGGGRGAFRQTDKRPVVGPTKKIEPRARDLPGLNQHDGSQTRTSDRQAALDIRPGPFCKWPGPRGRRRNVGPGEGIRQV